MAQFTTTTQLVRERTVAEGFTPDLSDVILADHGMGSKRHRAFTIQEIADLIFGGETDEIVLRTTGGGQEVTLTITPSAITFTKVSGNPSVTTTKKIDFNGNDSFLDAMRLKTLSGATAIDATHFKLVIDTVTEMLENVSIGTTESNKNLTVHGNVAIDGAVNSNLDVGTSQNPANLKVTGTSDLGSEAKSDLFKADEITANTGGANGTVTAKAHLVQEKQSKIEGLCLRDVTNEHDGLWLASKHGATQDLYNKNLANGSFIVAVNDSAYDITLQYQSSSVTMTLHPGEFKMFFRWNGTYVPFAGSV